MVLSEAEAESRLAALRREREALDRAIADLTLYLELGRRLRGGQAAADGPSSRDPAPVPAPVPAPAQAPASGSAPTPASVPPFGQAPAPAPLSETARDASEVPKRSLTPPAGLAPPLPPSGERSGADEPSAAGEAGPGPLAPSGVDETKSVPDGLSEGALARRYGRALIREALAVLEAAGRPLHAGEILSALAARGFTVPGQQDPVAALNTRLWKRSGPGGPLRRLGDAIYAPAEGEAGPDEDR